MKNSIFALFLFCFMASGLIAQSQAPAQKARKAPVKVQNTDPVAVPGKADTYSRVPEMPEFPGCETLDKNTRITCAKKAMMKYIFDHPGYKAHKDSGLRGTCSIKFTVNKDGSVSDVGIMRALSDDPLYLKESASIFKEMPAWTPGMLNGKAVNVQMEVPLTY